MHPLSLFVHVLQPQTFLTGAHSSQRSCEYVFECFSSSLPLLGDEAAGSITTWITSFLYPSHCVSMSLLFSLFFQTDSPGSASCCFPTFLATRTFPGDNLADQLMLPSRQAVSRYWLLYCDEIFFSFSFSQQV